MPSLTDLYTPTPLWPSPPLAAALGRPVLLKMEAFQPTGSFKARGMGAACLAAAERGARRLVCASGGNAGLAVAAAGRALGLPVTVVVFETAAARAKELIAAEGAELVVAGRDFAAAHAAAQKLVGDDGAFIHPFDDPAVWRGNATLVDEIAGELAAQGVRPGAVVLSVGGGGLLAGVVEGMQAHGWGDVPVLAAETEGAASFAAAVAAGRLVSLEGIDTIAATLGATTVCARALALAQQHPITPWVVSDREALDACLRFADDHRLLVEPACGAALAPVYAAAPPLRARPQDGPVVVVVCGGAGVTLGQLQQWQDQLS